MNIPEIDQIKVIVDGFVSRTIRLRTTFLEHQSAIRAAAVTLLRAPLTRTRAAAIAGYFSTVDVEIGMAALKAESQCESAISLIERLAKRLKGTQGRFVRRQIERMRAQLTAFMRDVSRIRGEMRALGSQIMAQAL